MNRAVVILALGWSLLSAAGEGSDYWAFQPVRRPLPPKLPESLQTGNPLDAFVVARLATHGLTMGPRASRRELARRAYFDLVGLPPAPEEMEAFLNDESDQAWERLIDDLLARPQYGERWGRHWLDVVRFAESNGYERDGNKPYAWRYRDYVIRAFNDDKPYDRFILEQLAGDELPGFSAEAIEATGFYRLHVWDDEPDSTVAAEFDDLDDIMVTTSGAFLGLTMGCARCHDHKFDPISQKEYYQMLAFFRSINPHGQHHTGGGGRGLGKITRLLASPEEMERWETSHRDRMQDAEARWKAALTEEDKKVREEELKRLKDEAPPFAQALAVTEDDLKPTHVLLRGRYDAPGEEVHPSLPEVLRGDTSSAPVAREDVDAPKRRLALARWIASRDNPLTARVMVNRVWYHHFGRGLVRSPNDFGRTGEPPSHPDLLDYLADEFVAGGWSVKRLHKLIMMSQAYQMTSRATNPRALEADEGNEWFWRQNPRRLEGEAIRDSILAYSGSLNLRMGGPSMFPDLPEETHRTQDSARKGWGRSEPSEQARRSVYVFVKRALPLPLLDVFDYSTTSFPLPRRPVTTVAPQALMLLNDDFIQRQAAIMADRLRAETDGTPAACVDQAFRLVLQRSPSDGERERALALLAKEARLIQEKMEGDREGAARRALIQFCVAMFNLNETVYVD